MNTKAKGTNAERQLIHMFWKEGWSAMRAAGSGSSRYPCPDILAGNGHRKVAIEVKTCIGENQYFAEEEIAQLQLFSRHFGAEAWVAVRFSEGWFFQPVDDHKRTDKAFVANKKNLKMVGLVFEEFISD